MDARGEPEDDSGSTGYISRRERSPSLVRLSALVVVAAGVLTLLYTVSVLYVPSLADPAGIDVAPLFGLTNIAVAGTAAIFFGGLTYLYAVRAGV